MKGVKTALVFVPHEDDEINLAGATICRLREEGTRVICVFLTNGDWLYSADIRFEEALASLAVLGVPEEDAIFLGYPDGGVRGERSLFLYGKTGAMEAGGHRETYGSARKKDFATKETGHATSYTWDGLLGDVERLLRIYRPDLIIGTDFDRHPDHRMASIALDIVMGRILNQNGNDWFPLYLKGFAYSLAFEGEDRFFSEPHLPAARIHQQALAYPEYGTDNPAFPWAERLRFPVPESCRRLKVTKNTIFKALTSYVSQRIFVRTGRLVTGDQVFWQRRTDNLLHQAQMTASSGEAATLCDFQTMYVNDITEEKPIFTETGWLPQPTDTEKFVRVRFLAPKHIETMSLWGNSYERGRTRVRISFDNGYQIEGSLSPKGRETRMAIEPQDDVTEITLHLLESDGQGLAEWGIYETAAQAIPLLHICVNDAFAYDEAIWPGEEAPIISAYTHDIGDPIRWFWNDEEMPLSALQEACQKLSGTAIIRAKAGDLEDEIRIERKTICQKWKFWWKQKKSVLYLQKIRLQKEGMHHAMKKEAKRLRGIR